MDSEIQILIEDELVDSVFAAHQQRAQLMNEEVLTQSPDALREAYAHYNNRKEQRLVPGSLATWKAKLQNKIYPSDGEPCIVMSLLDDPIEEVLRSTDGTVYARNYLDMEIGFFSEDSTFHISLADSCRFTAWESPS